MLYFLDASAILKLLFTEATGSKEVKELCRTPHVVRRTTWLCLAEVYGRLKSAWINGQKPVPRPGQKQLDQKGYDRKLFDMQKYVQKCIKLEDSIHLKPREFQDVRHLLKTYRCIDYSDALHIVVLKQWRSHSPVFVTSDKALICAAQLEKVEVWNPESGPFPE